MVIPSLLKGKKIVKEGVNNDKDDINTTNNSNKSDKKKKVNKPIGSVPVTAKNIS